MTKSELQCTNMLIDYFFKEFVYRNLYVYIGKQKKELCDGLVEFQDAYVIFQIKEKCGSTAQDWLQKKVYKKAVSQIKDTIMMIKNGDVIEVENYTGEKVVLETQKKIFPVIIFDSEDSDYKQIHTSSQNNDLCINVFSMIDFRMVLEHIAIPHDIVSYLEIRSNFFESTFPDLFINEISEGLTTLAKIEDEEGMIDYFIALTNGNKYIDPQAIESFQFVIKSFQERLLDGKIYNKKEYKEILKYLLKSNRNTVHDFMLRWKICVEHCMKKEETIHHFLIDTDSKVGYLYLTEMVLAEKTEFVDFILRLFKYKFELETVVGVVFHMINEVDYTVEWVCLSFENEYNEQYEKILEQEKLWSNIKQLRIY